MITLVGSLQFILNMPGFLCITRSVLFTLTASVNAVLHFSLRLAFITFVPLPYSLVPLQRDVVSTWNDFNGITEQSKPVGSLSTGNNLSVQFMISSNLIGFPSYLDHSSLSSYKVGVSSQRELHQETGNLFQHLHDDCLIQQAVSISARNRWRRRLLTHN